MAADLDPGHRSQGITSRSAQLVKLKVVRRVEARPESTERGLDDPRGARGPLQSLGGRTPSVEKVGSIVSRT